MTRIQLQNGFIDLPIGIDFPIDLSFGEITKNGARSGGVSRTIDIDGNENNTVLLGAYFDVDLTNGQFNRNKKTECSVIQGGVVVFEGYIQLLEVTRVNKHRSTNRKHIKYKISIFDDVANFFNEMGEKELTELAFPELTHEFNRANIINSWSNTEGFTYPQFAKDDNIYTLRDFKPAIYELEYFKKIFAANGYTYQFGEQNTDAIRLNKRIIPYNGKTGDDSISALVRDNWTVAGTGTGDTFFYDAAPSEENGIFNFDYAGNALFNAANQSNLYNAELTTILQDAQAQYIVGSQTIKNLGGDGRSFTLNTSYSYSLTLIPQVSPVTSVFLSGGQTRADLKVVLAAQSTTNPNKIIVLDEQQTAISFQFGTTYTLTYPTSPTVAQGVNSSTGVIGNLDDNEEFKLFFLPMFRYIGVNGNITTSASAAVVPLRFQNAGVYRLLDCELTISNLSVKAVPNIDELIKGTIVDPTLLIPKKIKQRDLIASIGRTYNLLFIPDPTNAKNIIIKTRDKYYEDGLEWDWTSKFEEKEISTLTFLSNEVANKQTYKYKDDKDAINTRYQNAFLETYGQTSIVLDNEYAVGQNERVLIYSPTPSVPSGVGVPLPSINGVNPDCNIRVLLHNGVGSISQYTFYDDLLPNPNEALQVNTYNKTSMFDNDFIPNFAILYDAPRVLFHTQQTGQTSNYLYQLHFQNELTTINEGRKLTGYFNLTESDFQKLSKRLDYKIFIKDNGWFFISKISGYNSNKRTLTKVELITADDKVKLKFKKKVINTTTPLLNTSTAVHDYYTGVANDTNIVLGTAIVTGKYNYITGNDVYVLGSNNKIQSNGVHILGNNNTVDKGLQGTKLLGDDMTPTRVGVYVFETSSYTKVSADYTARIIDTLIEVDTDGQSITIPEVKNFNAGKQYTIKNTSTADIGVTCVDDIDGVGTITVSANESVTIAATLTTWIII
jgi:hypothetical protein